MRPEASPHDERPLIEVVGVSKVYRKGPTSLRVLDEIDITIARGDFVALMGPSGSGKSTLLHLISGLERPTEGKVRVAEVELASLDDRELAHFRARHVGFVFQLYHLLPVLSAEENVELPLLLTSLSRSERREHAQAALRAVGLAERRKHRPGELSGGEQQRVAIARAIVTDPTLLIADEPTGDLDRASASQVLDLLQSLHRELRTTIVMVTHDASAAARASRTYHLDKGTLA